MGNNSTLDYTTDNLSELRTTLSNLRALIAVSQIIYYPVEQITSDAIGLQLDHQFLMADRVKSFCIVNICNHHRMLVIYCNCLIIYRF